MKYPADFAIPSDQHAHDLIAIAHELGINALDTAPAYGRSEERLGAILRGRRDRDRWIIATKVGETFTPTPDGRGQSTFDFSARATRRSIERSLQRLGTDRLDIVLVHSDGRDEHIINNDHVLAELETARDQGLIRAVGVSTKTLAGARLAAQLTDAVMLELDPADPEHAAALEAARTHHAGVLVKKALASGHAPDPPAALAAAIATPGVTAVVVGTINLDHLRANARAAANAAAITART